MSKIYLESSTRLNQADSVNQPELDHLLEDMCPDPSDCSEQDHLVRRFTQVFAPPGTGTRSAARLHPDAVFSIFMLLLLVRIYQMAASQPGSVPVALVLLIVVAAAYPLGRKWILRRHRDQTQQVSAESAVKRWGQLCFCSRDHVVFHPQENRLVPLDQIQTYLNEP